MTTLQDALSDERFEGMFLLDGYDDAFIGVTDSKDGDLFSAVYDIDKIVEILAQDMRYEDAWEYFQYNVAGLYLGDQTPTFIRRKEVLV